MKKATLLTVLAVLALSLTMAACSGKSPAKKELSAAQSTLVAQAVELNRPTAAPPEPEKKEAPEKPGLDDSYENAVPAEQQLLLGIFKLEGTEQAVTVEQAGELLSLWNEFKTIAATLQPQRGEPGAAVPTPSAETDDTEALEKIEDIFEQILAVMTPEQIQAIVDLKITRETARTIMEEQGITMGGPGQAEGGVPADGQQPQGGQPPEGGQLPQGTLPADGQQPGAGQAPQDGEARGMGGGMIPTELIEALIKLLESK